MRRSNAARFRPLALKGSDQLGGHGLRPELERLAAARLEPGNASAIDVPVGRAFEVDVPPISAERMLDETGRDRSGLDEDHLDAGRRELEPERVGQSLDGEF